MFKRWLEYRHNKQVSLNTAGNGHYSNGNGQYSIGNGQYSIGNGQHSNDNGSLIEVSQVVKTFENEAGTFVALNKVDLQVEPGEFVAVIGKSGSGKSTLINMIAGIDRPTAGEVMIKQTPIHTFGEGQMARWRGQYIGVIFQFFQLLPTLTVAENVMLPMDFCRMFTPREREDRAMHLLEQVDMADQAHKLPSQMSGGQQQRVAIARALANDPPLLLADEPTGNLDSATAGSVFELFERLVNNGKTILMVTHDNDLARRASRIITIADGEIVREVKNGKNQPQPTLATQGVTNVQAALA
ncbi:MAG: ABC transporter ATP-binding protein [Anaerolineae bacterium]|nr:ABC transporter ATP-binding protein [Anaerolineae bacterium]